MRRAKLAASCRRNLNVFVINSFTRIPLSSGGDEDGGRDGGDEDGGGEGGSWARDCDASWSLPCAISTLARSTRSLRTACSVSSSCVACVHFLREMAPPGRGCVVWTFGLVSAPSYPRHLSHSQPRALATHANSGAAGLRPPPLFWHKQNKIKLPRHPVCSPVASRVSALLLPLGRDVVGPSSVSHGVKAKCSGSWPG